MISIRVYSRQRLILGVVLLLTILFPAHSYAQSSEERPAAIATPNGVFIYLGRHIPRASHYELEAKGNRGKYTKAAVIKAPRNQQEMENALIGYQDYFEMLNPLTRSEIDKMWNYLNSNTSMDSLYVPNLPLMHLAAGTAYLDRNATAGTDFQYRVSLYRSDGTLINRQETNTVRLPPSPDLLKPAFKGARESGHQIMLEWYVPEQRQLSSYGVFRRVFGQGEYQTAPAIKGFNTNQDSVFLIVTDTAVHGLAHYEYYVVPLDAYGNAGPPSETVGAGNLGKYVPVVERFRVLNTGEDHQVRLSWHFEAKRYLRSIEIHRSFYYDSGFVKIAELPPADSSYIDHTPQGSENYYYYMVLNGPSAKSYPSAVISVLYHDDTAPEPPTEIAAETIDNGIRLHWTYQEPFVKGFLVYRSELPDGDFRVVSPLIPFASELLSYTDTSDALQGNQAYYYAIGAVSDSDISSRLSKAINGTPGVKTVISPPQNLDVQWEDGSVMVKWDDLRELEEDLQGYVAYRREEGGEFEVVYTSLDGSTKNYFKDTRAEPGKTYAYSVQAQDLFGQQSSLSAALSFAVPLIRPVSPSRVNLSVTSEGVHIAWGQLALSDLNSLRLYRQEPGLPPEFITILEKDQLDYLDKAVERGKLYSYYLTSVNTGNIESDPGQLATIRY